jgi:hypothetical protein
MYRIIGVVNLVAQILYRLHVSRIRSSFLIRLPTVSCTPHIRLRVHEAMPSSPSTGAHLGPTEDPPFLAVHHDLNLAAVTCFSGRKPDRQAREHPPPTSSLF